MHTDMHALSCRYAHAPACTTMCARTQDHPQAPTCMHTQRVSRAARRQSAIPMCTSLTFRFSCIWLGKNRSKPTSFLQSRDHGHVKGHVHKGHDNAWGTAAAKQGMHSAAGLLSAQGLQDKPCLLTPGTRSWTSYPVHFGACPCKTSCRKGAMSDKCLCILVHPCSVCSPPGLCPPSWVLEPPSRSRSPSTQQHVPELEAAQLQGHALAHLAGVVLHVLAAELMGRNRDQGVGVLTGVHALWDPPLRCAGLGER